MEFGMFVGTVVAEWLNDGRDMRLEKDFAYIDPNATRWFAPKGSIVNGASIPRAVWSLIGGPFEGKYRNASVVHDVACEKMEHTWEETHLMLYRAMRASGVWESKSKLMYFAVYHFGPRWSIGRPQYHLLEQPTEEDAKKAEQYFLLNLPSLDEIKTLKLADMKP